MKKVMTGMTLFLMAFTTCRAGLYAPPDEWMVDGPGGKYGVYSFHSQYSFIALGSHEIEIPMGFKATRVLFLATIAALGLGILATIVLTTKKIRKKRPEQASPGYPPQGVGSADP